MSRRILTATALVTCALFAAGCGGKTPEQKEADKAVFKELEGKWRIVSVAVVVLGLVWDPVARLTTLAGSP